MDKIKSVLADRKIELALLALGSSVAAYFLLKKNNLTRLSHVLVVMNNSARSEAQNYLKQIGAGKFDSEIEAEIIKSIQVFENENVSKQDFQFQEKSYLNVVYLAELLRKSETIPAYDVLYSSSTTSTQIMTYKYFEAYDNPFIYVADTQSKGRGRRSNAWESPIGSILITFTYIIKAEFLVVVQYLASLAIHEAILERTNEKFTLKWPNDTYYANEKIAGNLVQASDLQGSSIYKKIFVGAGINMDNQEPTTCINRILESNGKSHITAEQLIVTMLEKFAKNLEILEEKGWENGLAKVYYTHWEDYGIEAELKRSETEASEKVKIQGIDTQGNLVLLDSSGNSITINPNLYSYDNIHKIVHPKV